MTVRAWPHIVLLLASTAASAAWSQTADQPAAATSTDAPSNLAAAGADASDEIIVTARRREENLEKVPIAITAFGADQLRARTIVSESDLQSAVPGLTIRQNGSANQFNYSIRGQSVDTYTNSPPGVLPYIDEVQVKTLSQTAFYDLSGVQVLKGPQGTLFGRNATGGAVLYQTAKPGDAFDGYVLGRYGNHDQKRVEGAVDLPAADWARFRIAGVYNGGGAYVYDTFRDRHIGNNEQKSVRGTLQLTPGGGFTNTTVLQYTREGGTNTPSEAYNAYGCGATNNGVALITGGTCLYDPATSPAFQAYVAAHPNLFPGGVIAYVQRQKQLGPYVTEDNVPTTHRARTIFAINTSALELGPELTLKNIFGYNRTRSFDGFDYDGTPYPIFQTGGTPTADGTSVTDPQLFHLATRQVSEELQLQGKAFDNRLVYVIGAYYLDQRDEADSPLLAFDFSPIAPASGFKYHQLNDDRSLAGFAQATYKLTDKLSLTGGFRYTHDRVTAHQYSDSVYYAFLGRAPEKEGFSKPSWNASLDYQATNNVLFYITTRGSWRAGGYNYSVLPLDVGAGGGGNAFGAETTRDIEGGVKYSGRGLGLPVTFNADAFNQWVSNIQRAAYVLGPGGSPDLLTVNVPRAEVTGVEAEASVRPAPWLLLGASGAFIDARYTRGGVSVLGEAFEYGPYADTPRWTGTLYAQAEHRLAGDMGALTLRFDVYGQTRFFFSNVAATRAPGTVIPGYSLTNARLGWSRIGGTGLSAAFYVRNLFDKIYYPGGNAVGQALGVNTINPGQPRFFGGELRFDF